MSLTHWFLNGLSGLGAISSFAGFLFHAVTGNVDMALIYMVGIGGCAAIGWMGCAWRQH